MLLSVYPNSSISISDDSVTMRKLLTGFVCLIAGMFLTLFACELFLNLLPVSRPLTPTAQAWPLHGYAAHQAYQYSLGWAMQNAHAGSTNNYGQISSRDYLAASRPLIVVGDSYVEALMNEEPARLQSQLSQRLADPQVYSFGLSGLSASDYLVMARQTREEFGPRAVAFVITDGDFSESLIKQIGRYQLQFVGENDASLVFTPLQPNPMMEWLRAHHAPSAFIDYLRYNLAMNPSKLLAGFRPAPSKVSPEQKHAGLPAGLRVADWFLTELPAATGLPAECIALLVDSDRYGLYDPRLASRPKDAPEVRAYFIDEAAKLGFTVVDLQPVFRAGYAADRRKFDHWPIDRHWNVYGHRIVAEQLLKRWRSNGAGMRCGLSERSQ